MVPALLNRLRLLDDGSHVSGEHYEITAHMSGRCKMWAQFPSMDQERALVFYAMPWHPQLGYLYPSRHLPSFACFMPELSRPRLD